MRPRVLHSAWRGALLLAGAAVVAACYDDDFPPNAERFDPPPQYALWWNEAETCSHTAGDASRVRWYRTPRGVDLQGASHVAGQYDPNGHRIALAGDFVDDGRVVRHEILHALHPRVQHPRDLFLRRCGDVVPCTGTCASEAGPTPIIPDSVRRVLPEDIVVSIHVTPSSPGSDLFEGHFVLVVVARNPFDEPVMVNFPDSNRFGGARTFGYQLGEHPRGSLSYFEGRPYDRSAGYFLPRESKRAVYDFKVRGAAGTFPRPGSYFAFGAFNNHLTDTIRFTIRAPQ